MATVKTKKSTKKPQTIDEFCGVAPGSFQKFIRVQDIIWRLQAAQLSVRIYEKMLEESGYKQSDFNVWPA